MTAMLAGAGRDACRESGMERTGDGGTAVEVTQRREDPGGCDARGRAEQSGGRRKWQPQSERLL